MHIFRYQSALISLALYQIFYAQVVFAKVGGKFNLAVRNETQTEGLKPANCVLENANWCGIELDSYSTQVGCRNVSPKIHLELIRGSDIDVYEPGIECLLETKHGLLQLCRPYRKQELLYLESQV